MTRVEKAVFRQVLSVRRGYRNGIYLLQESFVLGFRKPRLLKAASSIARWHLARQVPHREPGFHVTDAFEDACIIGRNDLRIQDARKDGIKAQGHYILRCLALPEEAGGARISVRPSAQVRFNAWVQRRSGGAVWVAGAATAGASTATA
ncbi:hypothetical protein [Actinomadura rubrisoli]|uniref:Uncharacterized protein n=1 Tax=Actinomadura rubrisoli TaxID=2530368 RepID=A0A4R5AAL2_9ACTN|nr:hypothetical protein [Actinomadura rubrisoli]TDD67794.1 hypothetical protein E1298_39045 [Actinomadura rubrisoli]